MSQPCIPSNTIFLYWSVSRFYENKNKKNFLSVSSWKECSQFLEHQIYVETVRMFLPTR